MEIQFKYTDTLYVLGDVIDCGPDGVTILQDMMNRPNVIPIWGNHEFTAAMCLPWFMEEVMEQSLDSLTKDQIAALGEWIANGSGPTLWALRLLDREMREEILEYRNEMDIFAEVEAGGKSFVLVHAGLDNFALDKPLAKYNLVDFLFSWPEAGTVYYPEKMVVFGHTPTRQLSGQNKILSWGTVIDIDCGCDFGGPLGCLCLETMEEFYV